MAASHEQSSVLEKVISGTTEAAHDSFSCNRNPAPASHSTTAISDTLSHANNPAPRSGSSGRRLYPVIYTGYEFEKLRLGVLQYSKDEAKKHEELGVKITREDVKRHWRKQVRREYKESNPMSEVLLKQMKGKGFRRFWKAQDDLQVKDSPATCPNGKTKLNVEDGGDISMDVDEPAIKSTGKATGQRRRRQRLREARKKTDASMDISDPYSQEPLQAGTTVEQAEISYNITETAPQELFNHLPTEPNYELAAAPVQKEGKIFEASPVNIGFTVPSMLQSNRLPGPSDPPLGALGLSIRDEHDNTDGMVDSMDWE